MADLPLGSAVVEVKANTAPLKKGLKDAKAETEKAVGGMAGAFGKLRSSISGLSLAIGGLGLTAAAAGFAALVTRALNAAEAIADLADRANISAERLQELRFAFTQNGVEIGKVDQALVKFNSVLGEFVATGAGAAQQGFKLLGIETREAAVALGSTGEAFDEVVKRLSSIEDPARRAGVAARVFGEEAGPALAVLIGQGSAKIEELSQKARELGVVLREDAVRQAAAASAQLRALGEVVSTQVTGALVELAPQITEIAVRFADSLPVILQYIGALGRLFGIDPRPLKQKIDETASEMESLLGVIRESDEAGASYAASRAREEFDRLAKDLGRFSAQASAVDAALAQAEAARNRTSSSPLPPLPSTGKEKERDEYTKLLEAVRQRQALLEDELRIASVEVEAQERVRASLEASRIARELEAAAVRDGITLTPALRAEIEGAATAYEVMANAIDSAKKAQEDQTKAAEEGKRAIEAVGNAIVGGIQQADSFSDALKNVGLQLANLAIQGLFGAGPLGSVLGGVTSSIFGGISAPGRATGGGVAAGIGYLVNEQTPNSELFVPSQSGAVLSVSQAQEALRQGGGSSAIEVFLSQDLEARILQKAGNQSVAITKQGLGQVPSVNRDQKRRGLL